MGGYEIEFPDSEFLVKMKTILKDKYPTADWRVSSCRDETTLPMGKIRNKMHYITVQLGNTKIKERKMWINGELDLLKKWLQELDEIYLTAFESIFQNS